jgi:tRNA A58 N-methylase Trm61
MDSSDYVFGNREEEQHRLERQAEFFNPLTERVFQAAGLRPGMRLLDLGSGAGDVAMLAARLIGSEGEVIASSAILPRWWLPRRALSGWDYQTCASFRVTCRRLKVSRAASMPS